MGIGNSNKIVTLPEGGKEWAVERLKWPKTKEERDVEGVNEEELKITVCRMRRVFDSS